MAVLASILEDLHDQATHSVGAIKRQREGFRDMAIVASGMEAIIDNTVILVLNSAIQPTRGVKLGTVWR